jgi:hypothetical protein
LYIEKADVRLTKTPWHSTKLRGNNLEFYSQIRYPVVNKDLFSYFWLLSRICVLKVKIHYEFAGSCLRFKKVCSIQPKFSVYSPHCHPNYFLVAFSFH